MTLRTTDPASIRISNQIYGLLLIAYPPPFRAEYGLQMAQVFRDCSLNAYFRSGITGVLALWPRTIFDWFKTVIEERFLQETDITREKFIRLAGWGMMLGAVTMQLGILIDANWIRVRMYRMYGPPVTRGEYDAYMALAQKLEPIPVMAGLLLLVLGVAGLRGRFHERLGRRGQEVVSLALAGGVLAAAGAVLLSASEAGWTFFSSGVGLLMGCLAAFGRIAVREGLLPGWTGRTLLVCYWFPAFLLLSFGYGWISGGDWLEIPGGIDSILMTLSFASLLLLGFEIQRVSVAGNNP